MVKSTLSLNRAIKHCITAGLAAVLLAVFVVVPKNSTNVVFAADPPPNQLQGDLDPNLKCADGANPSIAIIGGVATLICADGSNPAYQQQQMDKQKALEAQNAARALADSGSCKYISTPFLNVFCNGADINKDPVSVVGWITSILTGVLGLALVITLLISAIQLISAGASPEMAASAKKRISIAALSLGLLIGLQAILTLIGV
jgi:hypothetical protein